MISVSSRSYFTRYVENSPPFKKRHHLFKNSFFPSTVIEWNKIEKNFRKSEKLHTFNNAFQNLYGHLKTEFITAVSLKELNY